MKRRAGRIRWIARTLAASVLLVGVLAWVGFREPSHAHLLRVVEAVGLKPTPPGSLPLAGCGLLVVLDPDRQRREGVGLYVAKDGTSMFEKGTDGGEVEVLTCRRQPVRVVDRLSEHLTDNLGLSEGPEPGAIALGGVAGIDQRFQKYLTNRRSSSCCMSVTDTFDFGGYRYSLSREGPALPAYVKSIVFVG